MSMVIQNNLAAVNAHNSLGKNVIGTKKASEKLSSGFRINRAADDAAGLAVSEKMRSQLRGLNQAIRNANDGISLIQTAEGAMEETHSMLHRLQELATQSANDTYDATDRIQMQREATELLNEITRIAKETDFNGIRLFNGSRGTNDSAGGTSSLQTSLAFVTDANGKLTADLGKGKNATGGPTTNPASGAAFSTPSSSSTFLFGGTKLVLTNGATNNASAVLTSAQMAGASGEGGITIQIGAYSAAGQRLVLNFGDMSAKGLGLVAFDITTLQGAQVALGDVDGTGTKDLSASSNSPFVGQFNSGSIRFATNLVNSQRAQLGAWQNRLESTVNNLTATSENLQSAESRIRDTDMAKEMINFTKFNILQQAAQAMLAQANQAPQAVLQLLR